MVIKNPDNMLALRYNKRHLNELMTICHPLFKLSGNNIKTFSYHCFFPNQTHFSVGTDINWMEFYLLTASDSGGAFLDAIRQTPYNAYKYFLWPPHHQDDNILSSLYTHNIWNGLSILQRYKNYVEVWSFSSTRENDAIKNFYINNLEEIKFFIKSFQYKASKFINLSKNRPLAIIKNPFDISYIAEQENAELKAKKVFKEESYPKKFLLTAPKKEKIILTKREYECLCEISKGKTYKEVAKALSLESKSINARTVESYVNNIKDKFVLNNKSDLIEVYHNLLI